MRSSLPTFCAEKFLEVRAIGRRLHRYLVKGARMMRCILSSVACLAACITPADSPAPAAPDAGARRVPVLPATPYEYDPPLPPHAQASLVPGVDNTPADNPITDAGATLGRVLFHDRLLSRNETVACASCHQAGAGFADPVVASRGFGDGFTARNSMSTIEVRFYARGRMFWDERSATLEDQVLRPIQDAVEMGLALDELVARVSAAPYYAALFEAAFGDEVVTADRISRALAQYVRSIRSFGSRWDEGVTQVAGISAAFPGYTAEENRGKAIFFGQHDPATRGLCGTCHMRQNPLAARPPNTPPVPFTNVAFFQPIGPADNGLTPREGDLGVGGITGVAATRNLFKPPSLRNVASTGPYMHDGRFATLEEVVEFYDHGITATPNLHPALRNPDGTPFLLNLSAADKRALVAFLHTLTDDALATDPRFTDPFPAQSN
jgi:cytochrome c peroxidase